MSMSVFFLKIEIFFLKNFVKNSFIQIKSFFNKQICNFQHVCKNYLIDFLEDASFDLIFSTRLPKFYVTFLTRCKNCFCFLTSVQKFYKIFCVICKFFVVFWKTNIKI